MEASSPTKLMVLDDPETEIADHGGTQVKESCEVDLVVAEFLQRYGIDQAEP